MRPILYILYTADFTVCLKTGTAHLCADDYQLHISYELGLMENAIDQLNSDLEKVIKCIAINDLNLRVA